MSLTFTAKKKRKLAIIVRVLTIVGFLAIAIGLGAGAYQYLTNRANATYVAEEIDKANRGLPSSMPATTKPDDNAFANYRVAPDAPRYMYIDKIAVKAMVKPMGIKDNAIEAPANVHDAGWFTQSAKPGQVGAMLVDGHVANWATKSVFHDLKNLRAGDVITIERGDGKKLDYRVVKSQSYDASNVDMNAALQPVTSGKPGLNLITCDGKVIKGNEFDKRLVVFTEQL
jgi:LPXTG-site transpeptidase (sortase) family protein